MPKTLASRSHASNAALQIGIKTNDAMHHVNYGPLTVCPDGEEQKL
jgi:hypothetical protein